MKKIIGYLIVVWLLTGTAAVAQSKRKPQKPRPKNKPQVAKLQKPVINQVPTEKNQPTITVVMQNNNPVPVEEKNPAVVVKLPQPTSQQFLPNDVQSGNVLVNVSSNGNAAVKIGLAPRGVTVIDFPADDPVYRIHPGDENFVTVGCLARDTNGKCGNSPTEAIVLRPGANFHNLGSEEASATIITVQRVSGMVVSFIVVPVKTISENANYVVVRYDLADVIKARREAGLATNLTGATSVITNETKSDKTSSENDSESEQKSELSEDERLQQSLVEAIQNVAGRNAPLSWSKPLYGLAAARAAVGDRTREVVIDVIAVRNTTGKPLRLVPDQPELVVESREKTDQPVQVERLSLLQTATTVEADDVLMPGEIYYFAVAYRLPILGVKQVLRISFAHREAADMPLMLDLSERRREGK